MKKTKLICWYCNHKFFRDEGHLNKEFKLSCPKCGDVRFKEIITLDHYPKDYFKEEKETSQSDIDPERYYNYYGE